MVRTWRTLCLVAMVASAAEPQAPNDLSPAEMFARARATVLLQLKKSSNYSCTEVVDRSYFYVPDGSKRSCAKRNSEGPKSLYLHDRLRLDVAVSDGGEVFSWHGGEKFSSAGIESIVRTGAVSSGSFVGYLNNVFAKNGIVIRDAGRSMDAAREVRRFTYDVPLASSSYHIQVAKGKVIRPFHGSFNVDERTFQLTSLDVIMDQPPEQSDICSAASSIHYQIVKISGQDSLIPSSYLLSLDLLGQRASTNATSFTDCHAFQGESVIHYTDMSDTPATTVVAGPLQYLPEGVRLRAAITTPINDQTSYTGDPVEATLTNPVGVPKLQVTIHKGAKLKGVVSRLEYHYEPGPHYLLSVVFNSVTDGPKTYRLSAGLTTPPETKLQLAALYHVSYEKLPGEDDAVSGGAFVFLGKGFHTPGNLRGTWITNRSTGE